jgi:DNA-binding transcriptional LysR family regulator
MNIRQMQYIMEIAKEGSVTAAASNLFISQPSLSSMLASVEKEVGAKLFDRSVSPLVLTYAGQKYVAAAENILGTLNELRHEISDMSEAGAGQLSIGCGPQQSPFIIPIILPVLMKKYPKAQFVLTEESKSVLEERLLKGTIDVIICSAIKEHPNIVSNTLSNEELILLAPPEFAALQPAEIEGGGLPKIELEKLRDARFALMKRGHHLRLLQDRVFEDNHFVPNVIMETDNWQTCYRMVESSIACTVLPFNEGILEISGNFAKFSLPQRHFRHTVICYRKNGYHPKLLTDFIETTRACLGF